jgi:hypothetical protein
MTTSTTKTRKTTAKTKPEDSALDNVFGTIPTDSIFLPSSPYGVRLNCKDGRFAISEKDFLGEDGDVAEISIIKVSKFFGTLGKAIDKQWMQLFYVPCPTCDFLPKNTVCCSYLKTRSMDAFNQTITKLMGEGVNPAVGIFKLRFIQHSSELGQYYSVGFSWRERNSEEESKQLEMIGQFMTGSPLLLDMRISSQLTCIDGMSSEQVQSLMDGGVQLPAAYLIGGFRSPRTSLARFPARQRRGAVQRPQYQPPQ